MTSHTLDDASHGTVSSSLRRVSVTSWKAPIIFGIFALLFMLLPMVAPREGSTTFRLTSGRESLALPDVVVPSTLTAWVCAIVLILCAGISALRAAG